MAFRPPAPVPFSQRSRAFHGEPFFPEPPPLIPDPRQLPLPLESAPADSQLIRKLSLRSPPLDAKTS